MARSATKIRDAIITRAIEAGIVKTIDTAVAAVPGITPKAASVPLMSISLDDLQRAAQVSKPERAAERPSDDAILETISQLATDADATHVDGLGYVRATKVAARLGVTSSEIRRRMQALAKSGRIKTIGKAAGKRYAVVG